MAAPHTRRVSVYGGRVCTECTGEFPDPDCLREDQAELVGRDAAQAADQISGPDALQEALEKRTEGDPGGLGLRGQAGNTCPENKKRLRRFHANAEAF